jgi:thiamine pyrophosphate-dependent acetolactate synthase large subunit-like protein
VTGVTRPITKHNVLVKDVRDLARTMHEAFHIARTGRPGPVVVDIAVDATMAKLEEDVSQEMDLPGYKPCLTGNPRQIRLAAEAINAAERPVLYVGGGVILSNAVTELRALIAKTRIPVTTTLLGLGAVDEDDELSLRMLGMHGSAAANYAVQDSDCLIAVGARFEDRVTCNVATSSTSTSIRPASARMSRWIFPWWAMPGTSWPNCWNTPSPRIVRPGWRKSPTGRSASPSSTRPPAASVRRR